VAVVAELPDRSAESRPLPVDEPAFECSTGEGREAAAPRVVVEREPPGFDQELLLEVFAIRPAEREPAAGDDTGDERSIVSSRLPAQEGAVSTFPFGSGSPGPGARVVRSSRSGVRRPSERPRDALAGGRQRVHQILRGE
jgi:hypothetical protein